MNNGNGKITMLKKGFEKSSECISDKVIDGLKMTESQLHSLIRRMEDSKKNYVQKHPLQGLMLIMGLIGGAYMMFTKWAHK